jgi:phosphatidylglycerol---prolipoprotein diacylglyceryl transferase
MSPVLFTLGDWDVQAYGFFVALALVVGWAVAMAMARHDRLPPDIIGSSYVLAAIAGVLAARAAWVLQHPDAYEGPASLVTLEPDRLAPFFGIVVGLLVSALHLAARKIPPTVAWDAAAPAFAVGTMLERLGALLAGSGAGKYAPDLPWAIRFPLESPVFAEQRRTLGQLLPSTATASLPVHPTQIYGIVLGAIGLWLCLRLRKNRRFSGQLFLVFAMYVLVARAFVEEWFRADAAQAVLGPLNGGQVGALLMLPVLYGILVARGRRAAGRKDGLRLWEGGRWTPKDEDSRSRA